MKTKYYQLLISIIAVIIIVIFIIFFNNNKIDDSFITEDLYGIYLLDNADGNEYDTLMILYEDDTYITIIKDINQIYPDKGRWKVESNILTINSYSEGIESNQFQIDGNKLILESQKQSDRLVFKKIEN